jgi:hypothetical protein
MKTKFLNLLIASSFILLGNYSFAQFGVNGPKSLRDPACYKHRLDDEDYDKLKKSTVYFVCTNDLLKAEGELESIFDDAWNYSDIKVIKANDVEKYINKENSAFFTLGEVHDYVFYELWMIKDHSKEIKNNNMVAFGQFCLFHHYKIDSAWWKFVKNKEFEPNSYINFHYDRAKVPNLKPYIVANYLKLIEGYLESKNDYHCNDRLSNIPELKNLKDDTLYISNNLLDKIEQKRSGLYETTKFDEKKLMSKYPHPYKFISFDEINDKIKNGDDFYYCLGINISSMRLSVFKGKTGECIFNEMGGIINGAVSYYCHPKDFGRIASEVKKND